MPLLLLSSLCIFVSFPASAYYDLDNSFNILPCLYIMSVEFISPSQLEDTYRSIPRYKGVRIDRLIAGSVTAEHTVLLESDSPLTQADVMVFVDANIGENSDLGTSGLVVQMSATTPQFSGNKETNGAHKICKELNSLGIGISFPVQIALF